MSRDAALAFLKMAMDDESLQNKILELAKAEGYEFTVDELTEDELDQAAGGLYFPKVEMKTVSPTTISYKIDSPTISKTIMEP